ncbi:hypothetical protein [[Mycobacterium] wendilense]|uniref:Recombinase A n=1 Tax=[Mycobacterium] wendilense TaxID=3064284 RepID=A0ABM9MH35_9MYCO|nr:hypothetical protein [Mycolicibacterium sp. MU0050]CAJ1585068.1 hypothetical protein MU0050_003516 [Mycolicibacterium sp. MU0050]
MTAALSLNRYPENRSEQVEQLRRQIAAVSGKVGASRRGHQGAGSPAPAAESLLPVPESLAGLLPRGLPRGVVGVLTGARSLPLNMVAAVTAGGGYAAIVGDPRASLLAAVEMGADLSRLAVIPDPGADPLEVATVLMDGMDLVVLDLSGRSVAPTRSRSMMARARHKGCTLLVTGSDWPGAQVRLDARVRGYELTGGSGAGRVGEVRLALRARGRCARAG